MLNSVQLLRAIAAWMVVFYHTTYYYFHYKVENWIAILFVKYGAAGVDIFFVISGFVIYKSALGKDISSLRFILSRLIRIVPAYWLFTLLTAALVYHFNGLIPYTSFDIRFLIHSLLFIPYPNPTGVGMFPLLTVGWTLNYEMAFYAIFALSLMFPRKYLALWITLGIAILQLAVPKLGGIFNFYKFPHVNEFLFGVLVAVIYQKGWLNKINFLVAIAMIFISLAVISTKLSNPPYIYLHASKSYLYKVGFPCAIILAMAISQEKYFPTHNLLVRLGDWSYSTYLSHVMVLSLVLSVSRVWHIDTYLSITLSILAILAISYASYTFIESKASRYLKSKINFT